MVIVFDLDDTLYDETTYVKSGFKAVAAYLAKQFNLPEKKLFSQLTEELENGRGSIFDSVLKIHGIYSKALVKKCVVAYRFHTPEIKLSESGKKCLERLKNHPLYIVTDGNKIVQHHKIKALGVDKKVTAYYITHRFGVHNAKPSPHCFLKICEREKTTPEHVVYIADNVSKDFVGIRPLGFKTVQVLTGQYTNIKRTKEYQADQQIRSLDELTEAYLLKLFSPKKKKS
jgi:putative hydrolase of the HAD superfamily